PASEARPSEPVLPPTDAMEAQADALLAAGDVDAALAAYTVLLAELGTTRTRAHAPIYSKVGAALRIAGQNDEARDYYEAAIDIDPNLVTALSVAAELRALAGDAAGARELYERTLELDTNALPAPERAAADPAESGAECE